MVTVTAMPRPTTHVTAALLREERFNVVLLSGPCALSEVTRVNAACREAGAAFFFVDIHVDVPAREAQRRRTDALEPP